jgi:photosystem II stability/assembly factor-like uncharacterized protein
MDGGAFRSDNLGETWTQKVFVRQERKRVIQLDNANIRSFRFDRDGALYMITRENGIWRSSNSGDQWTTTGLNRGGASDLAIDPDAPAIQYVAVGAQIQKSVDAGSTWQVVYTASRPLESITSVAVDPNNPRHVLAATSAGSMIDSNDSGTTWKVLSFQKTSISQFVVHPQTAQILYAVTPGGLEKSLDGGATWTLLAEKLKKFPGAAQVQGFQILRENPDTLFLASNAGLLTSPDGGNSWIPVPTLVPIGTQISLVAARDARTIFIVTNNKLQRTTDGGRNWRTLAIPTGRALVALAFIRSVPPPGSSVSADSVLLGTLKVKKR